MAKSKAKEQWWSRFAPGNAHLALAFKIFKATKVLKVTLVAASAASYAWLFTWQFSCIIIFALVVHEYGHCWAMRRLNVPTKGFYLIPFVGGAAVPDRDIKSRLDQYLIVMAGPLFGLGSALVPLIAYWIVGHPLLAGVAGWIATLNLINLLPITPLDGGRIVKTLTFSTNRLLGLITTCLGLVLGAIFLWLTGAKLLGIILAVGIIDLMFEWRKHKQDLAITKYDLPRCIMGYLALIVTLVAVVRLVAAIPEANLALKLLEG